MSIEPTADQPGADAAGEPIGTQRSDRRAQRNSRIVRLSLLGMVLVGMTGLSILHQRGGTFKPVGVDALCPFGGVETLWALLAAGTLIQKVAVSSVVLLLIVLVTAVLFGRAFCGYLCPLGALQEFAGKLRGLLGMKKRAEVPASVDRYARVLKYVVLAFFTAWTWSAASLVIRPYDPWVAWTHITSAELLAEFSIGLAILGVSIAGSVVYDRFFCKYACPMGALLGLMKPLAIFGIRRNAETCIDCGACDSACSVNVAVATVEQVTSAECIACNECVNACPVADTLTVGRLRGASTTALSPNVVAGSVAALTLGVVLITSAGGVFQLTMPSAAEALAASPAGAVDVEQIKGSMTFAEIAAATGIAPEVFQKQFGVGPADMSAKIKDLAPIHGFDVHTDVREFVREQLE